MKPTKQTIDFKVVTTGTTSSNKAKGVCAAADCGRPLHSGGYCGKHYTRLLRHGNVDANFRHNRPPTKLAQAKEITKGTFFLSLLAVLSKSTNPDKTELSEKVERLRAVLSEE